MAKKYPRTVKTKAQKAKFTRALNIELKKGRSEKYAKRVATGIAKGKTKQQARGHKVREHVERKEREREKNEGLTKAEIERILHWYRVKFNLRSYRGVPSEEDLIDWAREHGYVAFKYYKTFWQDLEKQWIDEGRPMHPGIFTIPDMENFAVMTKTPQIEWLYYH